ncbi:MAG: bifunctional folylpolyglutamate synthase/dihydrofolate synthase, partial [Clostridia bacterium]|nr:bifunctional folylpolyglutamate synthase/dihydrofolate synthase [Clostridia bacterium]
FEYFARKKCDIVICEVGMGGEFDATNVILPPELSVICNIGLDHTEVLGDTLEKIAGAKAGIIKEGSDAVIYRAKPSVEAVFEETCKRMHSRCIKADFDSIELVSHGLEGQCFNWGHFENLQLPLLGDHQLHNAAVVLTAATALQEKGWNITDEDIRTGIATVSWPGRFEILRHKPLFIVDGGHNPQCIEALVKNIDDYLQGRELTVLTGVLADKDYNCMYENVAPYVKQFVTITPASPRAMQAADLAAYLSRFGKHVDAYENVSDGVKAAVEAAGPDGVILCYGSLYMLGDIIAAVDEVLPKE